MSRIVEDLLLLA
jgi:signal transduction histidine kinase